MAQVTWTLRALDDLDALSEYYAATSPAYAARLIKDIFAVEKQLERFPMSGRVVPEAAMTTFREVIVRGYRVIYAHIDYERVDILGVRVSKMPLSDFPGESSP
jgi:toxin ParE1/3/4